MDGDKSENLGRNAPISNSAVPDKRIVALVRFLARHAAKQDFARQVEQFGKAHIATQERE